ncbi:MULTISPECIES: hypothetical protein [unclassified Leifsonia]|uniref:hypothetical protein n=1 Tax=unclassified Leifsonia TaxID=2663824 RepID=UPI0019E50F2E|nr:MULTISPECIES: hypothetical protein [unclassified Leifsonia]
MAPVPQLTDAQILELVHTKVAELIGADGEWTVVRRALDDTDTIFHSILAQSVSVGIAAAIAEARRRIETGESLSEPQHLAPVLRDAPAPVEAPAVATASEAEPAEPAAAVAETPAEPAQAVAEPAAMAWEPAPITQWTDLRKPVTGEFPLVSQRTAA